MSENSGLKNILRGKKTKVKKETSPNELYIKAMKTVADGLVGKMLYFGGRPVLLTDIKIGGANYYGEPTSSVEAVFMAEEKIVTEFFLDWEQFRLYFKTREEHETELDVVEPLEPETLAELATDLEKNLKNIKMTMAVERLRTSAELLNISKSSMMISYPRTAKPKRQRKFTNKK